jgi:hypothetical protein
VTIDTTPKVLIECPPDRVAVYVMDPANAALWIGGVGEACAEGGGTLAVDSRVARGDVPRQGHLPERDRRAGNYAFKVGTPIDCDTLEELEQETLTCGRN